jgi:2-polyprenyl-3-methyl-5-hydroxy-6-metoxy-1,4-benzoquinol methylase
VCRGCGLVSHHPLPDAAEVAAFYATRYRIAYKGAWEPKRKHTLRALRGAIARAQRLAPRLHRSARVLDVGASSGEFTHVMQRLGFDARGIEPNLAYADFARRTYGVKVESGAIENVAVTPGSVDLVTLNHVLEHLADPWQALKRIGEWLAPRGLLFIEVPNLTGVRKLAVNTFHTAHIWNFTPETLCRLAWQQGFVQVAEGDEASTSVVFRRRQVCDREPTGTGTALADQLAQQVATSGRPLSYLLSGAPLSRRMSRLRRNIDEWVVCSRYETTRDMADALIDDVWPRRERQERLSYFGSPA